MKREIPTNIFIIYIQSPHIRLFFHRSLHLLVQRGARLGAGHDPAQGQVHGSQGGLRVYETWAKLPRVNYRSGIGQRI